MKVLTQENYYEFGNGALTHSKIKDFDTCPNYFYRKHVLNEIEQEEKAQFIFGGIVDKLLSGEDFEKAYKIVDRKTPALKKEAIAGGYSLLNETEYNEIIEVASAVEVTDAFKTIMEKASAQAILQSPMELGEYFDCLAGKPDWFWIDGDTCYIVDLKTAATIDKKKYYYTALGYHYGSQLANYEYLISLVHPEVTSFKSFNLAVSKVKEIYAVELFEYPRSLISEQKVWLLDMIDKIKKETEFKKYNPSFDYPATLGVWAVDETYQEE